MVAKNHDGDEDRNAFIQVMRTDIYVTCKTPIGNSGTPMMFQILDLIESNSWLDHIAGGIGFEVGDYFNYSQEQLGRYGNQFIMYLMAHIPPLISLPI